MSRYAWNRQRRSGYPGDETIARSVGTALVQAFKSYQRARREGRTALVTIRLSQINILRDILEEQYSAPITS